MDNKKKIEVTDAYIEKVQQDSERCLNIFLGNLPKTECEKCSYKDVGVDCVRVLTKAQETVIKELKRRSKGEKRIEELGEEIFLHCSAGLFEDEANSIAEFVINKQGYRKASEVAEEIFAEIDILIDDWKHSRIQSIQFIAELAELKKKYTEQK